MSAIARENYAFLQSHSACPQGQLRLDDAGRLIAIDAAASSALQPGVAAACFRAKVWGHLIPRIRELRGTACLAEADALLVEVKELRKENPFSNPRFNNLLDELQALLEEISLPKKGIGKTLILPAAALALLAAFVYNRSALSELDEETLRQLVQAAQVASLAFAMLSQRMSLQGEGRVERALWKVGVGAGFVGCLAPFVQNDPIVNYVYESIISSLNQ